MYIFTCRIPNNQCKAVIENKTKIVDLFKIENRLLNLNAFFEIMSTSVYILITH